MNIEKIKKDITHHLNYVPEMSQTTYNALKGALDIINAIEDIKAEFESIAEKAEDRVGYGCCVFSVDQINEIIDKHIGGKE